MIIKTKDVLNAPNFKEMITSGNPETPFEIGGKILKIGSRVKVNSINSNNITVIRITNKMIVLKIGCCNRGFASPKDITEIL
jgi:hypothetical protein